MRTISAGRATRLIVAALFALSTMLVGGDFWPPRIALAGYTLPDGSIAALCQPDGTGRPFDDPADRGGHCGTCVLVVAPCPPVGDLPGRAASHGHGPAPRAFGSVPQRNTSDALARGPPRELIG